MPVRWVLPDPTGSRRALIATELGVWSTEDLYAAAVVWNPSNTNLANVRVNMLRLRRMDRTITAATYGRGLFTSNVLAVNPLPVELTAFTATAAPDATAVHLAWTTASEKNSARFDIERSTDGETFKRIGMAAAAGTSSTPRTYARTDSQLPAERKLYYRLHQVDLDGMTTYSPVRTVALSNLPSGLALFPNPARSATTLTGAAAGAPVTVFDAVGRAVATAAADANGTARLALPPSQRAGVYLVRTGTRSIRLAQE